MGVLGFFKFLHDAQDAVANGTATPTQELYANVISDIMSAIGRRRSNVQGEEMYYNVSGFERVAVLYIDGNPLIYYAVGMAYFTGEIFGKDLPDLNKARKNLSNDTREHAAMNAYDILFNLIVELVRYIGPEEEVYLCFDGAAPYAKMAQQKQRRYGTMVELRDDASIDTSAITAGSLWMTEMDSYLRSRLTKWMTDGEYKMKPKRFIYNSHMISGEGEHKIMDYLRKQPESEAPKPTVIYGNDSDLVLLSLLLKRKNIYVCKDYTFEQMVELYRELTNDRWPKWKKDNNFVNIDKMNLAVLEHLGQGFSVNDFVFIISIVGNDFISRPYAHTHAGDAIDNIIRCVKEVDRPFVNGNFVNWDIVLDVFRLLYKSEERVIRKRVDDIGESGNLSPVSKIYKEYDYNIDVFRDAWYYNALGPRVTQLAEIFDFDRVKPTPTDITRMCIEFLRGMKWIYDYYKNGVVSKVWYYPYFYAPLLKDIYYVLRFLVDKNKTKILNVDIESDKIPTLLHQLVSVMPPSSLQFVPEKLRPLWTVSSPIWDTMPQGIVIDKDEVKADEYIETKIEIIGNRIDVDIIDVASDAPSIKIVPFSSYRRINNALIEGGYKKMNELSYLTKEGREIVFEAIIRKEDSGNRNKERSTTSRYGNDNRSGGGFSSSRGFGRGFGRGRGGSSRGGRGRF